MEDQHKEIIRNNKEALAKSLLGAIDSICAHLKTKKVLNLPMYQDILAKAGTLKQSYHLLEVIQRTVKNAFSELYEACKEEKLFRTCDILRPDLEPHAGHPELSNEQKGLYEAAEDPWLQPTAYYNRILNGPFQLEVCSEDKYNEHIGNKDFYQMTSEKRGQLFVLFDDKLLLFDQKIFRHLGNKFNFETTFQKIKNQYDLKQLKFESNCDCFMIFTVASGQHGFFNHNGDTGLNSLKNILKDNQDLVDKPKIIFHLPLESAPKASQKTPSDSTPKAKDPEKENEAVEETKGANLNGEMDILVCQLTDYGCEELTLEGCGYPITRGVHLLVDVFLKHANTLEFMDLIQCANWRTGEYRPIAIVQGTKRRKLFFFPGYPSGNNDS